ncbi:TerB family tellurite resistance protein [Chryseosolibacter indicus]|uniref:TerB family tellurite resistance protein n=1 Tax=Chryseosolibacter indicus TaxID=2782351 RepID=A0ABS5VQK2_9BACT|nr:TerB family tellurite resistance protein [Chryseosolibacter indicus]MBT1703139.1 TerB family tellurite resistance protein [Chryseosolibacter indicus]
MQPLAHLKLLVQLAKVDGKVAEREKNFIINLGRANGIYPDQIIPVFEQEEEIAIPVNLDANAKFQCLYDLVQLMKIDERMYQEEIRFCADIATRLGYKKEVMFDLLLRVKTFMSESELINLKRITENFLKN